MLPLKIAWRFLVSSKGQTILILLGIAIGVSVQVFIGLLIQSLQISLVDRTIGSSSHITIQADREDPVILQTDQLLQTIEKSAIFPELKAVSPVSETPVFIKTGKSDQSGFMRGFDFQRALSVYEFMNTLVEGNLPSLENEVLIGIDLQK
ncbi:MAG TPA: ABC transporter permease, partial [Thermotogota bacterium]|nr:ABC transporter permease [Thermotogota bacterium]